MKVPSVFLMSPTLQASFDHFVTTSQTPGFISVLLLWSSSWR